MSASPHLPAVTLTRLLAARVAMLLAELAVLPWAHHFLDITWPVYKVLGLIGLDPEVRRQVGEVGEQGDVGHPG